jgi:hypothetical protein
VKTQGDSYMQVRKEKSQKSQLTSTLTLDPAFRTLRKQISVMFCVTLGLRFWVAAPYTHLPSRSLVRSIGSNNVLGEIFIYRQQRRGTFGSMWLRTV